MAINYNNLRRIDSLGSFQDTSGFSNSGNVEDFNDPNSDLSRGTSGLLNAMRMQREARIKEDSTPLSEKLFRVEMANRQARQKAAMYIKERELDLMEDKMRYDRIKDASALARAEADKEELRAKEKAKAELDYNSGYKVFLQDTKQNPSPETRAQYDSIMKPGQSIQPIQTPQGQTGQAQPRTIGQQRSIWVDKEREKKLKDSNLKLQEDTGYVFTPEEEQLSEEEKRNILLKKTGESGGIQPSQIVDDWINGKSPIQLDSFSQKERPAIQAEIRKRKEEFLKTGDEKDKLRATFDGKTLGDTESTSLGKAIRVMDQLDEIKEAFKREQADEKGQFLGIDINPIYGRLRGWNPYDKSAKEIESMIQAVVPNMARGIYGEVGVLTDNDIKNYKKILPRLSDPNDIKEALIGIAINQAKSSILANLKNLRMQGKNVSGYVELLEDMERRESEIRSGLESKIGQQPNAGTQQTESGITREQAIAELKRRGRI